MCNNYQNEQSLIDWAEEHDRFLGLHLAMPADPSNLTYAADVWPKYEGLYIRPANPADLAAGLEPAVGRWGLIPFFHKGSARDWKIQTNNCRSEGMATASSFRDALKRRRCIIPVSTFVEHTGPKGKMTKHRISAASGSSLFLAGLWSRADLTEGPVESYTMVTQAVRPGDDMQPFHDRQPVFLDAESARTWLDLSADYTAVLKSPPPGYLAFDPPDPRPTSPAT